jgi:hypothetical protein
MTRTLLMLKAMAAGLLAGCAGPGALPPSDVARVGENGPAMYQFTSTPIAGLPECKQYSATATVGGKPQPLTGEACRQPDGSWHIAEQPAGGTVLYQTIYWPPAGDIAYDACFDGPYVAGPYVAPCLYDFPFGFSVGFPVFIDIHHHFDRFVYAGQFHRFGPDGHFGAMDRSADAGDFRHGFHDGFDGGFGGGFGGGFRRR